MATISSEYREQQQTLHQDSTYGRASLGYAPLVINILEKSGFRSISDYGAGKCRLKDELSHFFKSFEYYPYDPAFPEYGNPQPADLAVCIDVLEHIEYDYLESVLEDLKKITSKIGLFTIHTGPAKKVLADGRNAHLIQQDASWWLEKLIPHFDIIQLTPVRRGFWVLVQAKKTKHNALFSNKKPKKTLKRKVAQSLGIKHQ